jgi:DeoR family suf operon transcriptional repressor
MTATLPGLAPHKGLRGRILVELKRDQPLTAAALAERFGVSANAVRRHLKELEGDGLVGHEREQRGQGAPAHLYRLTAEGEAVFPKQYEQALTDVLAFVAETNGREEVRRIFAERFRAIGERLHGELAGASLEQRAQAVVELLSSQGFMAEWSLDGDRLTIAEHNCAVRAVAQRFPEICQAEAEFLEAVLQTDVERKAYIPRGCNACEYSMSVTAAGAPNQAANTPREEP